jgi:hypothetical protein
MALGYIAAFSETLALAVIAEKGLAPLCAAVAEEQEDHLRAAAAWSLGQVGRHTPDHAKAVADTGEALQRLLGTASYVGGSTATLLQLRCELRNWQGNAHLSWC